MASKRTPPISNDALRAMHKDAVENVQASAEQHIRKEYAETAEKAVAYQRAALTGSISDPVIQVRYSEKDRQAFVDSVAIALYAKGYPEQNIYTKAERLWDLRAAHLATKTQNKSTKDIG